jgi:hypothetical protein
MHGPGDYERFPATDHPSDPRNDADDFEALTPEQEQTAADEAAYAKWESGQ